MGNCDYPLSLRNVEDLLHERDVDILPAKGEERDYTMLDQLAMAA
jgi:phage FluMu protein gp41